MSVKTNNIYGKISISHKSIAKFVSHVGMDSYGIVEFCSYGISGKVIDLLNGRSFTKGVRVNSIGDRIGIDVYVVVKFGVSIMAVAEALKESIKYKVERFSGMIVDYVNVNVVNVKK